MKEKRTIKESRPSKSSRKLLPGVVLVVIAAIGVTMLVRMNAPSEKNSIAVAPLFNKQGELTVKKRSGEKIASLNIEIADTPEKREVGLMGRPVLNDDQGMLFVFETTQPLAFWMENTIISLDMIFATADGRIMTIHRNTIPYSRENYSAAENGLYVIEVRGGWCDKTGVNVGDVIEWKRVK